MRNQLIYEVDEPVDVKCTNSKAEGEKQLNLSTTPIYEVLLDQPVNVKCTNSKAEDEKLLNQSTTPIYEVLQDQPVDVKCTNSNTHAFTGAVAAEAEKQLNLNVTTQLDNSQNSGDFVDRDGYRNGYLPIRLYETITTTRTSCFVYCGGASFPNPNSYPSFVLPMQTQPYNSNSASSSMIAAPNAPPVIHTLLPPAPTIFQPAHTSIACGQQITYI